MTRKKTLNEIKWEEIFERFDVLAHIQRDGIFEITARQIKEHNREPRLMTKFDHSRQLPRLFSRNGLSILPNTRGTYTIGPFVAYEKLEQRDEGETKPLAIGFPDHVKSLDHQNITSESVALSCAYVSGMLSHFLDEEELLPTVNGRMGSGHFSFKIDGHADQSLIMEIENSQIEIDAGFETPNSLALIEAKNALPEDFIIRQIYYPFRLWHAKLGLHKKIRSVFMTYSNGVFRLYEYDFEDPEYYNSLVLVKKAKYKIEPEKITWEDIMDTYSKVEVQVEPSGLPFPQANSFERVINVCEILHQHGVLTVDEITEHYAFAPRQTDYYANAGRYLGLIDKTKSEGQTAFCLSEAGQALFSLGLRRRTLEFARRILQQKPFLLSFEHFLRCKEIPHIDVIVGYMEETPVKYLSLGSDTFRRRASTVAAWIQWLVGLAEDD